MISASLILAIAVAVPVIAATLAIAYHVVRGTDPGPAADDLLRLLELVLQRRALRTRRARRHRR